jgi:ABC-type multidrug transport system fused ATPase/permease subunit
MTIPDTLRRSAVILRPHATAVAALVALSSSCGLLAGLADPLVTKWLIDSLNQKRLEQFVTIGALALLLYTALRLANVLTERWTQSLKNRICEDLTLKMLRTFYSLPYAQVARSDTGYFVSRIYDEPARITQVLNLGVQLANALVLLAGAIAVCLWLSWKVALVLSLIVPVLRWTATRYNSRISGATVEEREQEARLREGMGRAVDSYKTVNIFDLDGVVTANIRRPLQTYLRVIDTRVRHSSTFRAISGMLLSYAEMAVMIGAGFEVLEGRLTIGGLFGFVSAYGRAVRGFETLSTLVPSLAGLGAEIGRLEEFCRGATSHEGASGASIEIQGGSYRAGERAVLDRCNFSIKTGEKVLITGPNGSGKTTLLHIVCGLLQIQKGETLLPGLRNISALLTPFAFVPGTVKDNVNYASLSTAKQETLRSLSERFGLADKLDQDPAVFSEGEKRKLQVMMTLLRDADFYIFDEPLANVDSTSSDAIMDSIRSHTRGKAVVMTMHGGERYRGMFDREFALAGEMRWTPEPEEASCNA